MVNNLQTSPLKIKDLAEGDSDLVWALIYLTHARQTARLEVWKRQTSQKLY